MLKALKGANSGVDKTTVIKNVRSNKYEKGIFAWFRT